MCFLGEHMFVYEEPVMQWQCVGSEEVYAAIWGGCIDGWGE